MRIHPRDAFLEILTAIVFSAMAWAVTLSARAAGPAESSAADRGERPVPVMEYEVSHGDSLSEIALAHGVGLDDLVEVNSIEDPDDIRAGQILRIPGDPKDGRLTDKGVLLRVPEGFTLSRIAELYETSVRRIARVNGIENPDLLRAGRRILVPGATRVVQLVPPPPCYKPAVTLYRVRSDRTERTPLCYCDGRIVPEAVALLSDMSGPAHMEEPPFPLHPRLALLLQRVAERYPGKRIEIISGQRVRKSHGHESYHNKGRALDFRVEDVSNRDLSRFLRTFDRVGVGYYPNSVFVHMDARDRSAYWIDYSRPGERPIYGRAGMTASEVESVRSARRSGSEPARSSEPEEDADVDLDAIADALLDQAV